MSGMIGISTAEQGRYSVFYATLARLQRPENVMVSFARGAAISGNRNNISEAALENKVDWVLYLDDDHILHGDTLLKLLAADKDVISAHYVKRQHPFGPVILDAELPDRSFTWKQLHPKESGVVSVAAVGAGCLLVKRKVLEALDRPFWTLGQIHPASWGDDLDFCSRVRKAGFEVHVDLDNPIGHLMTGIVWPERDDKNGWVANFAQDVDKSPLVKFPMPMPGDF